MAGCAMTTIVRNPTSNVSEQTFQGSGLRTMSDQAHTGPEALATQSNNAAHHTNEVQDCEIKTNASLDMR